MVVAVALLLFLQLFGGDVGDVGGGAVVAVAVAVAVVAFLAVAVAVVVAVSAPNISQPQ